MSGWGTALRSANPRRRRLRRMHGSRAGRGRSRVSISGGAGRPLVRSCSGRVERSTRRRTPPHLSRGGPAPARSTTKTGPPPDEPARCRRAARRSVPSLHTPAANHMGGQFSTGLDTLQASDRLIHHTDILSLKAKPKLMVTGSRVPLQARSCRWLVTLTTCLSWYRRRRTRWL
jgi:hypothetical protein